MMGTIIKKTIFAVMCLALTSMAATPPQTVKDSMNGNWTVINGKKLFLSGMNIAWLSSNSFGNDVGDVSVNINAFTDKVKKIRQAGGNSLRWWLHTDASHSPKIDTSGAVTGLGLKTISNMRDALDTAYAYGVVVSMCLFSFDMLIPGTKASYSSYNLNSNYKFLTVPSNIDTYLTNALKPMLDSVGSHPAIMCWEVFNEPENMLDSTATAPKKITQNDILRITNKIAGFIHSNSKKMATTGIASFKYRGQYSSSKLIAAGAVNNGYLDFYMVHYDPEYQADSLSPFSHAASYWTMDKPIMVGRFPAGSWTTSMIGPTSGLALKTTETESDAFAYTYANGYAGALSWTMSEQPGSFFGDYTTTAPALTALFTAHQSDIMIKDVTIVNITGNYVMRVDFDSVPPPGAGGAYYELGTSFSKNFTGKTNLIFDMWVKPGSSTNMQIVPVIKVTSAFTWSPATGSLINLGNVNQGTWVTDTVPIANFGATSVTDVREILFQWWASGNTYDSGAICFDNIRVDNDTLASFNTEGSTWTSTSDAAKVSLVQYSDVPVVITTDTNNYVMMCDLKNIPAPSGSSNYFELGASMSKNLTGKTNLIFDMFVKPGSSMNLQFIPVLKVDSTYTWSAATGSTLYLYNKPQGQWFTDTVPIANFMAPGVTDVRQLLFQWSTTGAPYDSGDIYFDNFRADNDTLFNFNTPGVTWSSNAAGVKISRVKYSDVPVGIVTTDNYVMKYDLRNAPAASGGSNYFELGTAISKNFSGKTNLIFDMYVKPGSSENLQLIPVLKVDSTYTWSAANGSILYLNTKPQGQWFTDTVPIVNFLAPGVTDVRQMLFQWSASGAPYESGTIYFDNFRADNDTFVNFNTGGVTWTSTCDSAKISLVKYSDVPSAIQVKSGRIAFAMRPQIAVHGKTIFLCLDRTIDAHVAVFDLRGKTVGAADCGKSGAGLYTVSIKGLSAGPYIVEIGKGAGRIRSKVFLQ
jgi:hypothetical protein